MALILVAEDTPDILQMVKDIIETMGHQVITASDGVQMIEKAKTYQPKLIVADVMMPGAYGSAAYKTLQEDSYAKKIPIVFLTAITHDQADKVIPAAPNVKVLHKPVDVPTLMAAVTEMLPR
jgi:CheY-like chemotaxis protein